MPQIQQGQRPPSNQHHHGVHVHNARGDVVQRVDVNGDVLYTYRFDAFGNQLLPNDMPDHSPLTATQNTTNPNTNPFRFAGEYLDFETGNIYLRARYFNPQTGRFTQEDPHWNIGNMQSGTLAILQSGNLYAGMLNNPIRWIDPSGRSVIPAFILVAGPPMFVPPRGLSQVAILGFSISSSGRPAARSLSQSARTGGITLSSDATATQILQFERAIAYLMTSPTARSLIDFLNNSGETILVRFNSNFGAYYFNHTARHPYRIIGWDPTGGFVFRGTRNAVSPALVLAHEFGHAKQDLEGLFSGLDRLQLENDVIERFETPIAMELGEFWRESYGLARGVRVDSSTDWGTVTPRHPAQFWRPRYTLTSNLSQWNR